MTTLLPPGCHYNVRFIIYCLEDPPLFLDAVASLVLTPVSNSLTGLLNKIQALSLAVACMLHSYWLTQSLLQKNILEDTR